MIQTEALQQLALLLAQTGRVGNIDVAGLAGAAAAGDTAAEAMLIQIAWQHERAAAELFATTAGAPVVVLSECTIDLGPYAVVPADLLSTARCLPIVDDGRTVVVALESLDAEGLLEPLTFALGLRPQVLLGLPGLIGPLLQDVMNAALAGRDTWIGPNAQGTTPHVAVARVTAPPPVALPEGVAPFLPSGDEPVSWTPPPPTDASLLIDTPTVLVVEDDDAIRRMVADVMRAEGFEVVEAADGAAAIEHLRRVLPVLVVLDAMLPGVHGFEICRALKSSPTHAGVPVLMISAIYRGIDHARAIQEQHGADAFVEKPFHLLHLRNTAASLLKLPLAAQQLPPETRGQIDAAMRAYQGFAMMQDWKQAHAAVEQWIAADPFDGRGWLERGHMAMRFGAPDQALPSYEVAALYLPRDIPAQGALAMAYEQLGFIKKARHTWERLWQLPLDGATRTFVQQHLQALR